MYKFKIYGEIRPAFSICLLKAYHHFIPPSPSIFEISKFKMVSSVTPVCVFPCKRLNFAIYMPTCPL